MLLATKWETNETTLNKLITEKKKGIEVSLKNIVQNTYGEREAKEEIRNLEKQQSESFLIRGVRNPYLV